MATGTRPTWLLDVNCGGSGARALSNTKAAIVVEERACVRRRRSAPRPVPPTGPNGSRKSMASLSTAAAWQAGRSLSARQNRHSSHPHDSGSDVYKGEEAYCFSVVSGCDAPEVFDLVEVALDAVSVFVDFGVIADEALSGAGFLSWLEFVALTTVSPHRAPKSGQRHFKMTHDPPLERLRQASWQVDVRQARGPRWRRRRSHASRPARSAAERRRFAKMISVAQNSRLMPGKKPL